MIVYCFIWYYYSS